MFIFTPTNTNTQRTIAPLHASSSKCFSVPTRLSILLLLVLLAPSVAGFKCVGRGGEGGLASGEPHDLGDDPSRIPSLLPLVDLGGVVVDSDLSSFDRHGHGCALLAGGDVRCWGDPGGSGKLGGSARTTYVGDSAGEPSSYPTVDLGGARAAGVASGLFHSCALLVDGGVTCWGQGNLGQLGRGTTDSHWSPPTGTIELGFPVVQIDAGATHSCAVLVGGTVKCWGDGADGKHGLGHAENIGDDETPLDVPVISLPAPAQQVHCGADHTCTLSTDGTVHCWGLGEKGRLGHGTEVSALVPTMVSLGSAATDLAVGARHTCVVQLDGGVKCWGAGGLMLGYGETEDLGDNETPSDYGPVDLGGASAVEVLAGFSHTCVLTSQGGVMCWGSGAHGALGLGDTEDRSLPTSVAVGYPPTKLFVGLEVTCFGGSDLASHVVGSVGGTFGPLVGPVDLLRTTVEITTRTQLSQALVDTYAIVPHGSGCGAVPPRPTGVSLRGLPTIDLSTLEAGMAYDVCYALGGHPLSLQQSSTPWIDVVGTPTCPLLDTTEGDTCSHHPEGLPINVVEATHSTVTFTVEQTWKTEGSVSWLAVDYGEVTSGGDRLCAKAEDVPGGATLAFTARCNPSSGYADVKLFIHDGQFTQVSGLDITDQIPPRCAPSSDEGRKCKLRLQVPCTACQHASSSCPGGPPSGCAEVSLDGNCTASGAYPCAAASPGFVLLGDGSVEPCNAQDGCMVSTSNFMCTGAENAALWCLIASDGYGFVSPGTVGPPLASNGSRVCENGTAPHGITSTSLASSVFTDLGVVFPDGTSPDPDLLRADSGLHFRAQGSLNCTFVHESTPWRNELGFVVYDPTRNAYTTGEGVLFADASLAPEGCLRAGDAVEVGPFPLGAHVGFYLRTDKFSRDLLGYNSSDYFGTYSGEGIVQNEDGLQHGLIVRDLTGGRLLIGFEDQFGGSDFDYNDVLLTCKPVATSIDQLLDTTWMGKVAHGKVDRCNDALEITNYVVEDGRMYATIDNANPDETALGCQYQSYALPEGWELAPDDASTRRAITCHPWGAHCVMLSSGLFHAITPLLAPCASDAEFFNRTDCLGTSHCDHRILISKPLDPPLNELIVDAGFEEDGSGWSPFGAGFMLDSMAPFAGARSLRLDADPSGAGALQILTPTEEQARSGFRISAWSRAQGLVAADGAEPLDYALYADIFYADGTHRYGAIAPFPWDAGGEWVEGGVDIDPRESKVVENVYLYCLLRKVEMGTVWFDNLTVGPPSGNILSNPSFEEGEGQATGWRSGPAHGPSSLLSTFDAGRLGGRSVRIEKGTVLEQIIVNLDDMELQDAQSIYVGGWSKAENVSGESGEDYAVYVDVYYEDPPERPANATLDCSQELAARGHPGKIWICHGTASSRNPYVLINVDPNSVHESVAHAIGDRHGYASFPDYAPGTNGLGCDCRASAALANFEPQAASYANTVVFPTGTHGWQFADRVFHLAQRPSHIVVSLVFRNHTGVVWFDDIEVRASRCVLNGGTPNLGIIHGDPHLTSLDGTAFDVQAVGLFLLTADGTLEVQAHMAPAGEGASVVAGIALAIDDTNVALVRSHGGGMPEVWVNGGRVTLAHRMPLLPRVQGGASGRLQVTPGPVPGSWVFVLAWASKHEVEIHVRTSGFGVQYMSTVSRFPATSKGKTRGLLGNYNGNPLDDLGPIDPRTASHEELLAFAEAWRIGLTESKFPMKVEEDLEFRAVPLDLGTVNDTRLAMAEAACARTRSSAHVQQFQACLFDVLSTGDVSFAAGHASAVVHTGSASPAQGPRHDISGIEQQPVTIPLGPDIVAWNVVVGASMLALVAGLAFVVVSWLAYRKHDRSALRADTTIALNEV
jgi:hypothetical protein